VSFPDNAHRVRIRDGHRKWDARETTAVIIRRFVFAGLRTYLKFLKDGQCSLPSAPLDRMGPDKTARRASPAESLFTSRLGMRVLGEIPP